LKEQLAAVNPLSEQLADFNTRWNQRTSDIQFKVGDNGQVMWGERCDFPGTEIRQFPSTSEECGQLCIAEERCTHFSWSSNEGFPSLSPQVQFVREKRAKWGDIGKKRRGKGIPTGGNFPSVLNIPGSPFSTNNCYLKTAQNPRASPSLQEGICGWVTSRVASKAGSSAAIPFSRMGFLALFAFVMGIYFITEWP